MGVESTLRAFGGDRDVKLLLTGKRTAVYNMKLSEVQQKISSLSFNPDTEDENDVDDIPWDYGGRMGFRPLFSHYAFKSDAVLWAVDCSDEESINQLDFLTWETTMALKAGKRKAVHCVLLENKDAKDAISEEELLKILQLKETDIYKIFSVDLADTSSLEKPAAWVCETLHSIPEEPVESPKSVTSKVPGKKNRSKFSFLTGLMSGLRRKISA